MKFLRYTAYAFALGIGAIFALIVVDASYNSVYKHGYAECQAFYEDEDASDHWDAVLKVPL